jgi:iron complex transport system substrate-binding protein
MRRSARLYFFLTLLFLGSAPVAFTQIETVDDLGRTVRIAAPAQRIVSLAPSITETLFALGAGGQVRGVTDFCTYPPEAQSKPRVGGLTNVNTEAILALKPDLVVMSMEGNTREDFVKLQSFSVPIFISNPRTLEGIYKSIADLGLLAGRLEEAERLLSGMRRRADSVLRERQPNRKSVLLIVSLRPLIVAGVGSFLGELLEMAGGRNVAAAAKSAYPQFSREDILVHDPEVIVILSDLMKDLEDVTGLYPEWHRLRAVRERRVYRIDADILSRPGPRVIDGLVALSHALHQGHP